MAVATTSQQPSLKTSFLFEPMQNQPKAESLN